MGDFKGEGLGEGGLEERGELRETLVEPEAGGGPEAWVGLGGL